MVTLSFRRACLEWNRSQWCASDYDFQLTTRFTAIAVRTVRHALTFFLIIWTEAVMLFASLLGVASVVGFDGRKPKFTFIKKLFKILRSSLLGWSNWKPCETSASCLSVGELSHGLFLLGGVGKLWKRPWMESSVESAWNESWIRIQSWKRTQDTPRRAAFCARQISLVWLTFYCMLCLKFKVSMWFTVTCGFERLLNALNCCSHHVAMIVILEKQINIELRWVWRENCKREN